MKIRSQGRLHTSHSFKIAPLFPNPGYAPAPDKECWVIKPDETIKKKVKRPHKFLFGNFELRLLALLAGNWKEQRL